MDWLEVKDNATGQLQSLINESVTTVTLKNTHGAKFPAGNFIVTIGQEHLLVIERTGDVLSVVRGYDGTMASEHAADSLVELRFIAAIVEEIRTVVDSNTNDLATFADVVGSHLGDGTIHLLMSAILLASHPVNEIYLSIDNVNPSTKFGGTWIAWGTGRALFTVDTGQTEFNTVEKTGGAKTHTLTIAEMPAHYHTEVAPPSNTLTPATGDYGPAGGEGRNTENTSTVGGGGAHNNLPPYITLYAWKRTA